MDKIASSSAEVASARRTKPVFGVAAPLEIAVTRPVNRPKPVLMERAPSDPINALKSRESVTHHVHKRGSLFAETKVSVDGNFPTGVMLNATAQQILCLVRVPMNVRPMRTAPTIWCVIKIVVARLDVIARPEGQARKSAVATERPILVDVNWTVTTSNYTIGASAYKTPALEMMSAVSDAPVYPLAVHCVSIILCGVVPTQMIRIVYENVGMYRAVPLAEIDVYL